MSFFEDLIKESKVTKETEAGIPKSFQNPLAIRDTLQQKYGNEWLWFLPETIRISIKKDFQIEPNEILMNKILATQLVINNPYFDWDIFENIVNSFNDNIPDFTIIEPPSVMEMVLGYQYIKALQPSYEMPKDVESYCKIVMTEEGVVWCPWLNLEIITDHLFLDKLKELWKSPNKFTEDNMLGVQIDKLSIIKEYLSWPKI